MGTLAHWYSYDSTCQELSNEYQNDRVKVLIMFALDKCLHSTRAKD